MASIKCQAPGRDLNFHRCQDAFVEVFTERRAGRVGVTGGWSYLGVEIVKLLLRKGYDVRAIVDMSLEREAKELAVQKFLSELNPESDGRICGGLEVVECDLMSYEDAAAAFRDCVAIVHTASFVDPGSVSGFTRHMANAEVIGTSNAVAASAKSDTVLRLVMTSSAATVVWSDAVASEDIMRHVNQSVHLTSCSNCCSTGPNTGRPCLYKLANLDRNADVWSDPQLCREKKLWFALAKTEAEKAAWSLAAESGLDMVTVSPALVTGPDFVHKNATPTIAYLKGVREMRQKGLVAESCVSHVAHAHIRALERPFQSSSSGGRYFCFDRLLTEADLLELASALAPVYVLPM